MKQLQAFDGAAAAATGKWRDDSDGEQLGELGDVPVVVSAIFLFLLYEPFKLRGLRSATGASAACKGHLKH